MITDIKEISEMVFKIKGKSFQSFKIILAWEKIVREFEKPDLDELDILARKILKVSGEADWAETYDEVLKKKEELKVLRAKWEKYAPGKMIGIRIPELKGGK